MQHENGLIPRVDGDFAQWMLTQRRRSESPSSLAPSGEEGESAAKTTATRAMDAFKALMAEVDHAAIRHRGDVPAEMVHRARNSYRSLYEILNQAIGDAAPESDAV